ncbi:MAG: PD-(D/E)XK nuclease domain-containing protein, partial [Prevotella sp.]|nr:PD-(D/E)XK nuclease domain-containing protein [Prevotella sp.]
DALPLLYQSGYLTIKGYESDVDNYILSIPNQEVRVGFTEGVMLTYTGLETYNVRQGFAIKFYRALKAHDLDLALREMQAYIAGLPYIEGFKKKLADVTKAEGFYEWTFYLIFSMLNVYVRTQVKTIRGRADIVIKMPDAIYVMELKICSAQRDASHLKNGTAREALEQIEAQGYAAPFKMDPRPVHKVGICFSMDTLAIEEWEIEGEE